MSSWFRQNFLTVFFSIFAVVGAIMGIVFSTVMFSLYYLRADGIRTEGEVVDMSYSDSGGASPTVTFVTESGESVTHNAGMYTSPPEFEIGDRVTLWYDADNPRQLVLKGTDTWVVPLITGIFFLVFGGIGFGGLLNRYFTKKRKAWLWQFGTPIDVPFSEVRYNTSLKVNGASPFVITGQWHDKSSNKVYTYESDNIWYDPSPFVGSGRLLRVMIDPANPARYVMDTAFLPEEGN